MPRLVEYDPILNKFKKSPDTHILSVTGWNGRADTFDDLPTASEHNGEYYRVMNSVGTWGAWQLKHITSISDIGTSYIQHKYTEPEKYKAKTDIMLTVQATESGATGCTIASGFDLVLVED